LALRIGGVVCSYGVETLDCAVNVSAGTSYEVSVALHAATDHATGQPFELTASVAP
jgi:hypothetical protein